MAAKIKVAGKVSAAKVAKKKDSAKDLKSIEQSLWDTANKLRGSVESSEYKHVVLSLIFLKFASDKFEARRKELIAEGKAKYIDTVEFYAMQNVFYLLEESRWSFVQQQSKQDDIALKVDTALSTIEKTNKALKGALPDDYFSRLGLDTSKLASLIDSINDAGFIACKGQIVNAGFVTAPRQRNSREEKAAIKKGQTPEGWEDKPDAVLRQKDTDARWTRKSFINYYGYKNHVSVDNENKLVRRYDVTTASVHNSQVFDGLLDPDNTNANVWADSTYRSAEQEASLNENGYRGQINTKSTRNKPLSKRVQQANYKRSKVSSRVEHVFGLLPKLLSGQLTIPNAEKSISNAT